MGTVWFDPARLGALATSVRDAADAVTADTAALRPAAGDLGPVAGAHDALVERFAAGLRTGRSAVRQAGDTVDGCLQAYAATDDDASVTFQGLKG